MPLPVYGDGRQRREWLHAADHCAADRARAEGGAPGEIYNVGGEEFENIEVTHRIVELTGADPALITHVEDRAGHDRRYALDDGKLRDARLDAGALVRRDGADRDRGVVPREPRLVRRRQIRRVRHLLRASSTAASRLVGRSLARLRPRSRECTLRPSVASLRGPCPCGRSQPSQRSHPWLPRSFWRLGARCVAARSRRLRLLRHHAGCEPWRALRRHRLGERPRRRPEPVRRARAGARRAQQRPTSCPSTFRAPSSSASRQ